MGNVFLIKNLVSSGRKICYYARKQKKCNIASLKKTSRRKEEDQIRHPLLKWLMSMQVGLQGTNQNRKGCNR